MKKILAISLALAWCFAGQFKTDISYESFTSQDEILNKMFPNEILGEFILEKTYDLDGNLINVKRYIEKAGELLMSEEYENGILKSKNIFFTTEIVATEVSQDTEKLLFEDDIKCLGKPVMQLLYDENGFLKTARMFECNYKKNGFGEDLTRYVMKSETPYIYVADRNRSLEHGIEKIYENGELTMELSYKFGKLDGNSKCHIGCSYNGSEVIYKDGKKLDKAIPY